jgi:hypothetical protein
MKNIFFGVFLVSLVGCAPMMPAPTDKIETLPLVKMGAVPPSNGEYVLYIPAHSLVPVKLAVKGTLLEQDMPTTGNISFVRDVYLYKYWASHDRKHWETSHKLLDVSYSGGVDVSGLNVNITLDTK